MAGGILVFAAILGGAAFASAALKRRMAETIPLSVISLIALTYGFGLFGLLRTGALIAVAAFLLAGAAGLYLSLHKKNPRRIGWDGSLVFFALGFAWLLFVSRDRMPLLREDFTQWALAPKAMFYFDSLTPASGALSYSPALAVFQTVFQACSALFASGEGFAGWLLYVACGTACLALLLPFAHCAHPRRFVQVLYSALFFLAVLCIPLVFFHLFSELNPDGLLAILAAACFLQAAQKRSPAQAVITGLYLFVLTLVKDAGLYFALGALLLYFVTLLCAEEFKQAKRGGRTAMLAVPAALILLARLSWPHLSFALHGAAGADVLPLFWQNFSAKLVALRAALVLGGSAQIPLFTLHASFLALTLMLAGFTALLIRAMRTRDALRNEKTALWTASAFALLYAAGLWLAYTFAVNAADAAKLLNFQRLAGVGYAFWSLLTAAFAFRVLNDAQKWTWRRHTLAILACLCVLLTGSGALSGLMSRDFLPANEKYHTYYAVADEAALVIPEDAHVYIVSQSDDGTGYDTLRFALCPREVNPEKTFWLSDPAAKPNKWAYPITAEAWKAELTDYDYVLVYRADSYLKNTIAPALTADAVLAANTVYRVDHAAGLLVAASAGE